MERTLVMLRWWEQEYKERGIKDFYYGRDRNKSRNLVYDFADELEANGFEREGEGSHSFVYKHPKEKFVIKFSTGWDTEIYGSKRVDATNPRFLGYEVISADGNCAIQKFVNCTYDAQDKANRVLRRKGIPAYHGGNVGLHGNKAVIIDHY